MARGAARRGGPLPSTTSAFHQLRAGLGPDARQGSLPAERRRLFAGQPQTGSPTAGGQPDWCFSQRARHVGIVLGPIGIVAATFAGSWARGPVDYPMAWGLAGAVFVVPTTVLVEVVRRRCGRMDRRFWSCWLTGQLAGCGFGACLLVQPLDPPVAQHLGAALLALAAVAWGSGLVFLVSRTNGARVLAIDALEITVADLAVVAPVLIEAGSRLAHPRDAWFAVPGTVVVAGLPLAAALAVTLCARLPMLERRHEVIGALAAFVGELDAVLQAAQGVDGFRLPTAPLLAVQGLTMWLLLMPVLHAHRKFPAGLDRLSPDAQVRRWSLLPVLVLGSAAALAVEAVSAPATRPWVVPAVVAVLGVSAALMTLRHVLVVNETGRLYRQLAVEAPERHRLLDDLVQAVEDDRHRVVVQLHELAVERMAAIGAVMRACGGGGSGPGGDTAEVVMGALGRIYCDVGTRARRVVAPPGPGRQATGVQRRRAAQRGGGVGGVDLRHGPGPHHRGGGVGWDRARLDDVHHRLPHRARSAAWCARPWPRGPCAGDRRHRRPRRCATGGGGGRRRRRH